MTGKLKLAMTRTRVLLGTAIFCGLAALGAVAYSSYFRRAEVPPGIRPE